MLTPRNFSGHAFSNIVITFLFPSGRDDSLKSPTCVDLVNNCPHLTSLSLRGFKLHDCKVRTLVKVHIFASKVILVQYEAKIITLQFFGLLCWILVVNGVNSLPLLVRSYFCSNYMAMNTIYCLAAIGSSELSPDRINCYLIYCL